MSLFKSYHVIGIEMLKYIYIFQFLYLKEINIRKEDFTRLKEEKMTMRRLVFIYSWEVE